MDSAGFDSACWDHWLLVSCFAGMSIVGLRLSWQWRQEARITRKRAKLSRWVAMELRSAQNLSLLERQFSIDTTSQFLPREAPSIAKDLAALQRATDGSLRQLPNDSRFIE